MFSISEEYNRLLLVLILLVFLSLSPSVSFKYRNDNDAISDFHLVEGVVCDAIAANKRARDITDATSREMCMCYVYGRRRKTRKRIEN